MPEEPEIKKEDEAATYYEEVRADVETAVYALEAFENIDMQLQGSMNKNLKKAKEDCLFVICEGIKIIADGYR
jgi:hypothetical protein